MHGLVMFIHSRSVLECCFTAFIRALICDTFHLMFLQVIRTFGFVLASRAFVFFPTVDDHVLIEIKSLVEDLSAQMALVSWVWVNLRFLFCIPSFAILVSCGRCVCAFWFFFLPLLCCWVWVNLQFLFCIPSFAILVQESWTSAGSNTQIQGFILMYLTISGGRSSDQLLKTAALSPCADGRAGILTGWGDRIDPDLIQFLY